MNANPTARSNSSWWPYVVALVSTGIAFGLTIYSDTIYQRGAFVLMLAAVSLSAWAGGWKPAVLSMGLCTLFASFVILNISQNSMVIHDYGDILRVFLFVLVASLISWLHHQKEKIARRLEQSEQRLSIALDYVKIGVWHLDLKTNDFWWSHTLEHILGGPPMEFSNTYESFVAYLHPDDKDFVERAVRRTRENGEDFDIDHRLVRADKNIIWIHTQGRVVHDEQGQPAYVVAVVTERPDDPSAKNVPLVAAR